MKKRNITLLTALAAATALAPTAQAEIVVPPLGYEGDYRVVFATSGSPAATDTTMALLNTFVTGLAQATGAVDDGGTLGTTWSVVGATSLVDVFTNTDTEPGVDTDHPIYLVNGAKFADDYTDFWAAAVGSPDLDISELGGTAGGGTWAHTGLESGPITSVGKELDSAAISHGGKDTGYNPWYGNGDTWAGGIDNGSIFAISGVLTAVAPTEATILISGLGTFINPGDTTPSTADDTDFGSVIMGDSGGTPIVKTYTVSNFGTSGTLTLTSPPTVTGDGSAQFAVSAVTPTVLAAGATATFTVTYTPVSGSRSVDDATVSLASDAADNNPYTFDITATTLNDGVIAAPGDGYTGDYRIAFVTNGKTLAQDTGIAFYNGFVTTEAALVTELNALGVTWKCLGSTLNASAKINTGTDSTGGANDVPIYTTTGQRIADDNADLWDESIQNPIFYGDGTQAGDGTGGEIAWTGTHRDGTTRAAGADGSYLGSGPNGDNTANYMTSVRGGYLDKNWIEGPSNHDGISQSLMAMSSVITPGGSSSPYDDWATGSELFGDDANGDGVDNGLAWILGADDPDANALGKLPVVSEGGSFLILDFTRENPYTPATLSVQFGNDLSGWEEVEIPAGAGNISASGDDLVLEVTAGPPDSLKLKIPTSYESAGGALFARLVAREN